ncbi:unnamed protein product [Mesocestoides corti]|uniref:Dehydrogenase/reductase SDR family member 4 n=1 Tax=Mesocestoides corti TaxID=53468 RepID=A0A0R3UDA6_MESCO|nr:unnamed protein product [Mesocestoides corti]
MSSKLSDLRGFVCLVTGASRGIGRGIAVGLGECGATVYITARTLRPKGESGNSAAPGSLEETASEITARGGVGAIIFCVLPSIIQSKFLRDILSSCWARLDLLSPLINEASLYLTIVFNG